MNLDQKDIDQIIRIFNEKPTIENYNTVSNWYENNVQYNSHQEYMICIYLFLLGANIRHKYTTFTYDKHMAWIKEIRDLIESSDPLNKAQRKAYLDFGNKSGFFR